MDLREVSLGLIFFSSVGVMPVTFLNWADKWATLLYSSLSAIWLSVSSS